MNFRKPLSPVLNNLGESYKSERSKNSKEFSGLVNMTTLSDRKDLFESSSFNRSYSNIEKSLIFLKSTQNEIYHELYKEVDKLRMANKELTTKLVFLSNSSDILTNFPEVRPPEASGGAQVNMLSHYIDELQDQLAKELERNKAMEKKIVDLQKQIAEFIISQLPSVHTEVAAVDLPVRGLSILPSITYNTSVIRERHLYTPCKILHQDPSLPITLHGCHSMIISLVKSRDRINKEIKLLNKKLRSNNSNACSIALDKRYFGCRQRKKVQLEINNSNTNRYSPICSQASSEENILCFTQIVSLSSHYF